MEVRLNGRVYTCLEQLREQADEELFLFSHSFSEEEKGAYSVKTFTYILNGMEYSIDPIGADPIYKRYVDGSCLKQFQFALTSKEAYDGDARTGIANSGFYQNFEEWTEQNNLNDIVPELDGHDAIRVEVLQSGYLFSTEVDLGRYQMICRLIYK